MVSKRNVFLPVIILNFDFKSLVLKCYKLKTTLLKYTFLLGIVCLIFACSTKRNTFLSRNSHALSTKYNILYNGGIALDNGITELKTTYADNYWELLPVERMQLDQPEFDDATVKNANFERAEEKAIKAIQKHSMNIEGGEKNPQMDEAHLLLGKSRYYDRRYVPSLEAFNYVLYKYPNSDKIQEVKVWREKTNMRMDNDALAVKNLRKLLSEIKFKDQIYADANAALAQAFLNLNEIDSAAVRLRLATDFTKSNEEKARYRFIAAQLYDQLKMKDSAMIAYQDVIDMKRKSPRIYVIQAHAKQAQYFDYAKADTIPFLEKFQDLLDDRENRPYLDVINHQMALFYDKQKNQPQAKKYYIASLDATSKDAYLNASNYRNLADIFFDEAQYSTAGKYYDSTMVHLKPRTREFNLIKKKRENLIDVIKYEGIATRNDSVISVYNMSKPQQIAYYEDYIATLRKLEEEQLLQEEKRKESESRNAGVFGNDMASSSNMAMRSAKAAPSDIAQNSAGGSPSPGAFYFYNPTTVAYGKTEFRKIWGDRTYSETWKYNKATNSFAEVDPLTLTPEQLKVLEAEKAAADARFTPEFYISQLPTKQSQIDSISLERNFAYYQLGVIYKEKFKEYERAADKLENLLVNNPEERLVLPTLYNLYKIYEIIDPAKMETMRNRILNQYPESRYAQIVGNTAASDTAVLTPEAAYTKLYREFEKGDLRNVLTEAELAIDQYTGEETISKFELLKAHTIGKLQGLEAYKSALNYVALSYPNQTEGKDAERILATDMPVLEQLQFNEGEPKSFKILYQSRDSEDKNIKILQEKLKKFIAERTSNQLSQSYDIYTMDRDFVVVHGIMSEEGAKGIVSVLKEFKEYKVQQPAIVISSDNYKVVQIKKNLEEYLENPTKPAVKLAPPVIKKLDNDAATPNEIQPRAQKQVAPSVNQGISPPQPNFAPPGAPAGMQSQPSQKQPQQKVDNRK